MNNRQFRLAATLGSTLTLALGLGAGSPAQGQTYNETVVYSFTGGSDQGHPYAGLVRDPEGNLYGTTFSFGPFEYGTVFEIPASGGRQAIVLWSFTGGSDGEYPEGTLVRDAAGNLYGATRGGGASGAGVLFEEPATGGQPIVLWSFTGGADGGEPEGGVVSDAAGNLYGTTSGGGASSAGTVFEEPAGGGQPTVLWSFTDGADGGNPLGGLVRDAAGNLYGGTNNGGAFGQGVIFEEPAGGGQPAVLWSFTGGTDGSVPLGNMVRDAAGNLYGMAAYGGDTSCFPPIGCGTVFEEPAGGGAPIVLWSFTGGADGGEPQGGVVRDAAGNLYGTTSQGGASGAGTVFEEPANGGLPTELWNFTGGSDGGGPAAGLLQDPSGNFYGTTTGGGTSGYGTVFELTLPWQALRNQPSFNASTALLLTDGTVMTQVFQTGNWWKLTPDITGSYVNGTWSQLATMPPSYGPLYYGSAVLADGNVEVNGGEYNFGIQDYTARGALYDPLLNRWMGVPKPAGWQRIGDGQSVVLPDGTFMLADCCTKQEALFDETTRTWTTTGAGKADINDEEGWTLLPDGNVLTVDVLSPRPMHSEIYLTKSGNWISAGSTQVDLVDHVSHEIGPAILQATGTVFATGATGATALYDSTIETWTAGPSFPAGLDIADGPGALLPDDNVLVAASPGAYQKPTEFFEFDGANLNQVSAPPNAANDSSYQGRMLLLPTGQVLFTDGSGTVEVYTSPGAFDAPWQPSIVSVPATLAAGQTYTVSGTQLNGLSQANAYGDDSQSATNYPLVQITNGATGDVFYCRTHNHSSMGVATGGQLVSTDFDVPAGIESGASDLVVIANGIPSNIVEVTIQ